MLRASRSCVKPHALDSFVSACGSVLKQGMRCERERGFEFRLRWPKPTRDLGQRMLQASAGRGCERLAERSTNHLRMLAGASEHDALATSDVLGEPAGAEFGTWLPHDLGGNASQGTAHRLPLVG